MYFNMATGKTVTAEQAREIEKENKKLLESGSLSDLFKVQYLVKMG